MVDRTAVWVWLTKPYNFNCLLIRKSHHCDCLFVTQLLWPLRMNLEEISIQTLIARFMGPTWGPSGADRTQVGPMLAPWILLSGKIFSCQIRDYPCKDIRQSHECLIFEMRFSIHGKMVFILKWVPLCLKSPLPCLKTPIAKALFNGLMQDCGIPNVLAMEILQSCTVIDLSWYCLGKLWYCFERVKSYAIKPILF